MEKGGGGHAILAYGLEKDNSSERKSISIIKVYDNSKPNSNNRITN